MILKIFEQINRVGELSESPLITIPEVINIPRKGEYVVIDDKTYIVGNIMYRFNPAHSCIMGVKRIGNI